MDSAMISPPTTAVSRVDLRLKQKIFNYGQKIILLYSHRV